VGGEDHVDREFMSKLKGLDIKEFEVGAEVFNDGESNVEAKDMKAGLLAIVVYGAFDANPVLLPNPKSNCIAPSVAVG